MACFFLCVGLVSLPFCCWLLLIAAVWCGLYACCMFVGFCLSVYVCVAVVRVVVVVVVRCLCLLLRCVCCGVFVVCVLHVCVWLFVVFVLVYCVLSVKVFYLFVFCCFF